jgi:hypothetical protein
MAVGCHGAWRARSHRADGATPLANQLERPARLDEIVGGRGGRLDGLPVARPSLVGEPAAQGLEGRPVGLTRAPQVQRRAVSQHDVGFEGR